MRRGVLVLSLLVLMAGTACAAAYDDFARGLDAMMRGDRDAALAAFSAAIAAGDLAPGLLPEVYRDRGRVYLDKRQCQAALDDLDAALKLKPGDGDITRIHAGAAACLRKYDLAIADWTALIGVKPLPEAYRARGMLHWRDADFAGAAADFAAYTGLRPKDAYGALWLDLARSRAGQLDPAVAAHDARAFDNDVWPAPVLALYAGRTAPDATLAAAMSKDAAKTALQQCEADFYVGEWLLTKSDADAAKALIAKVRDTCPHDFTEYFGAVVELERLK